MAKRIDMIKIGLLLLIVIIFIVPSYGQRDLLDGRDPNRMSLSVYVDTSGKALVTGYAEDINGLDFLSSSHYRYQNGTSQLYALTDSLTSKQGDNWTLRFASRGYYDEYHAKFLLPGDLKLRKISCSQSLEYTIYTSNESFVAEVLGYDIRDPAALLEYQMPLEVALKGNASTRNASTSGNFPFLLIAALAIIGISAIAFWSRLMGIWRSVKAASTVSTVNAKETATTIKQSSDADGQDADDHSEPAVEADLPAEVDELPPFEANSEARPGEGMVVTREMAAVMEVLTARERAVLEVLIKHGGIMSQAEIRYETGTPGSSLTGILVSLERRNIVTKKEWGRTNLIELSEWFVSEKEDS